MEEGESGGEQEMRSEGGRGQIVHPLLHSQREGKHYDLVLHSVLEWVPARGHSVSRKTT